MVHKNSWKQKERFQESHAQQGSRRLRKGGGKAMPSAVIASVAEQHGPHWFRHSLLWVWLAEHFPADFCLMVAPYSKHQFCWGLGLCPAAAGISTGASCPSSRSRGAQRSRCSELGHISATSSSKVRNPTPNKPGNTNLFLSGSYLSQNQCN